MACQLTPNVLRVLFVTVPSELVTVTMVSAYGLMIKLPWFPAATNRLVVPPTPRKIEFVTESGTNSSVQSIPLPLVITVARSPTAT